MSDALSPEVVALAIEIADSCARSDIESNCPWVERDGVRWYDLAYWQNEFVQASARYLSLRGKLTRCEGDPHLVRWEA